VLRQNWKSQGTNKGGVGKTTISVNIATCLSLMGYKTLLIDLDSQSDASDFFGVENPEIDLYDVLKGDVNMNDIIVPINDYLSVTLCSNFLESNQILAKKDKYYLRDLFETIEDIDFIICDCSPTFSETNNRSLDAADCILIPIIAEYRSIKAIKRNYNYFDEYGIDEDKVKLIIPNMVQHNNTHKEMLELITEAFSGEVTTPIPRRVAIPRNEFLKKSIFDSDELELIDIFKDICNNLLEKC